MTLFIYFGALTLTMTVTAIYGTPRKYKKIFRGFCSYRAQMSQNEINAQITNKG
jgi:hypothetical protein